MICRDLDLGDKLLAGIELQSLNHSRSLLQNHWHDKNDVKGTDRGKDNAANREIKKTYDMAVTGRYIGHQQVGR